MVTLVQLEYIVAIDTYRHFVTAAEKCFVTQPTLSMQIKKLEEFLGVVIFDRTKQPIIPTDIGVKIIAQARVTLAESKRIEELVVNHNNTIAGELRIGIIPSLAPYLLPLFVGPITKKYVDIKLNVTELLSEEIIKGLKIETIDVGILVTPLNETGINEVPVFYEEILLYTNKKHSLATKEEIKTSDLTGQDLWLLNNGHCFRSQVINLCSSYNLKEDSKKQFKYSSGSIETIKKFVEIEGGFTLLPELAAAPDTDKACTRQFQKSTPLREISVVFTRNYSKKKLLDVLMDEIRNVVPSHMLDKTRGKITAWRKLGKKPSLD